MEGLIPRTGYKFLYTEPDKYISRGECDFCKREDTVIYPIFVEGDTWIYYACSSCNGIIEAKNEG